MSQINIVFDEKSLESIYAAGQAITIVKDVLADPPDDDVPVVAWLSIKPFISNVIVWNDGYGFYATDTTLKAGERIVVVDQTAGHVQYGTNYQYEGGNLTANPAINVTNRQPGRLMGFGLWQQATVNGAVTGGPLNVVPVENNRTARFFPKQTETVSIFLDDASPKNGMLLNAVPDNALTFEPRPNLLVTAAFNGASGRFVLAT